jgi:hypothetical protein
MQDSLKSIWQRLIRRKPACARYESLVSVYADGMASQKEARLVEAHIAACPECRALLASIRVTSGAFSDQPAPQMPAGLPERLRLAILQERLLEQTPVSIPVSRTPSRSLMPRLTFAASLAGVIFVAALAYDLRSASQNSQYGAKPNHVALVPKGTPAPINRVTPPVPTPSSTVVAKLPNTAGLHGITPPISHRRSPSGVERIASPHVELANGAVGEGRSRVISVINHPEAIPSPQKSPTRMAFRPAPSVGPGDLAPRNHPGEQVARVPSLPPTPDVHSDVHTSLPPPVNNLNTGEQPTMVATVPQPQPTPAAPEDTPRVRLVSRLHLIADNSAQAVQQMAKVAANNQQRPTEYSGSLSIVGSSIR